MINGGNKLSPNSLAYELLDDLRGDGMKIFFPYLFFVLTSFFLNAIAEGIEAPSQIIVSQVRAQGSGCPAGTVSGNISPDGSAFSLLMDNYQALSNGNNQLDRKMCEVLVDFSLEPGWSYALVSADYRGFVNVANGSVATHQAIYSFDGSRPINEKPGFENGRGHLFKGQEFRGPITDNYFIHTDLNPGQAPWSKCVHSQLTTLHITTYLTARSISNLAQTEANITLDSIDGSIQTQKYQLIWRKCGHEHGRDEEGHELNPRPNPRPPQYPGPGNGVGPRPNPREPRPEPSPRDPRPNPRPRRF